MKKLGMYPELKTTEDDEDMMDFMAAKLQATLYQDDEPIDVKSQMAAGLFDDPPAARPPVAAIAEEPTAAISEEPAAESNPLAMFLQAGTVQEEDEEDLDEETEALLVRMGRKPTKPAPAASPEPERTESQYAGAAAASDATPIARAEIRAGFVGELRAREEALAGVRKLIATGPGGSSSSSSSKANAAALPVSEVLADLAKVLRAAAIRGRAGFSAAAAAAAGLDSLASAVAQL